MEMKRFILGWLRESSSVSSSRSGHGQCRGLSWWLDSIFLRQLQVSIGEYKQVVDLKESLCGIDSFEISEFKVEFGSADLSKLLSHLASWSGKPH